MKITRLPKEQFGSFTHLVEIDHTDLTQTAPQTAQVIEAFEVKRGDVVLNAATFLTVPFQDTADAANNSCAIQVGDGGDTDRFIVSQQVNALGTPVISKANAPATVPYCYDGADTVDVLFGAPPATKTLAAFNRGKLKVYLQIAELQDGE
jgi:hypothetical protein